MTAPYGSWPSPITANRIAEGAIALGWPQAVEETLFWAEMRPREGGRYVIVRRAPDGETADVTPAGANARTLVHEYGGGMYTAFKTAGGGESVVFSAFEDQRLYRQDFAERWSAPRPLTPEPPAPRASRYADGRPATDGGLLFAVRERHLASAVVNDLVALPLGGGQAVGDEPPAVLPEGGPPVVASGHDFFSSPRPSPDGRLLAGLSWDHPLMPWDGTELWVSAVDEAGRPSAAVLVAGNEGESVVQPLWAPDGDLLFVSDRSGWWNLYRIDAGELAEAIEGAGDGTAGGGSPPPRAVAVLPMAAEFAKPHWVFGLQNAVFLPDGRLAAFCSREGLDRLIVIEPDGTARELDCELTSIGSLVAVGERLAAVGGGPALATGVVLIDPEDGSVETVRSSLSWEPDASYLSAPRPIEFPTAYEPGTVTGPLLDELAAKGPELTAHALYYAPHNPDVEPPEGERPPLIVISHGGPTSAAESTLSLSIHYWTTRGFAVVDVNYGGSSGHGRAYRDRLKGNWGTVDTVDCINAARFLAERGEADPARLMVRGGSAGGYTTLNALTRFDAFAAGASYFGLADLEMFVSGGTHKFEERYLIGLVGPYPERADVYRERSPIHHVDAISCPVIVLQGLEDAIVPPAQAEIIVAALRRNKLPYAYLAFEEEQHGFRKAENMVRSLEAELSFYGQVLGFTPADEIEPVEVENLA